MEYIVLDIETTGLDPENSSILEVGALLIMGGKVKDSFSSFIQYQGEIPETIRRLTGITEDMVIDAPPQAEVIAQLKSFIQKRPVVSHNGLGFDFPMLERVGLKFEEKYDSMEFAFFAFPTSPHGHSTKALAEHFSLGTVPHRALADCEIEFKIICCLMELCFKKPKKNLAALKFIAERIGWWWTHALPGGIEQIDIFNLVQPHKPYRKEGAKKEMSTLGMPTSPIDEGEVEKLFAPSPEYAEDRLEQKKMAMAITSAFNARKHAVIEAGTGTGKSKAYLVPSVLFALKNSIPLIVSTHTKALQDQLFFKEIPHLKSIIGKPLHITVLKGKQNYVCLRKLQEFIDDMVAEASQRSLYTFGKTETRFTRRLASLLLASWALETERGDWDEVPYWFKEHTPKQLESDICNLDELCAKDICDLYDEEKCFLAQARLRAKDADLVIVNHAIVLSGIVPSKEDEPVVDAEGVPQQNFTHTVFPGEAKFVVFDEAHHLEDDATSAWEHVLSQSVFDDLIQQIFGKGRRRGVADSIVGIVERKNSERLRQAAESFYAIEMNLNLDVKTLFNNILPNLVSAPAIAAYSQYSSLKDVSNSLPQKAAFTLTMNAIVDRLRSIQDSLNIFAEEAESKRLQRILGVYAGNVGRVIKSIQIIAEEDRRYVQYLERSNKHIEMKAALISVAEKLHDFVYDNFDSIVMTSATLTVDNRFNFFDTRCGTSLVKKDKISHHKFASSFDYAKQVKFFVPKDISYKQGKEKHFVKSAKFIQDGILASEGGALVLCTSHDQVEGLYQKLYRPLSQNNIWLLRQTKGMSVSSVIRDFASDINSVLIGTETLWQGIDVPGESLRVLFIYKILYRLPHLPLIRARKEDLDRRGYNGFRDYYEPLAALILKQGFGRLIRKKTDTGIAIMLEEELLSKPLLVNSLPDGVKPVKAEPAVILEALKNAKNLFAARQVFSG